MEGFRMPEVGVSIVGSKGRLDVNDDVVRFSSTRGRTSAWHRHDLHDRVPFWLGLPEYYREDTHFVEAVTAATKAEPDFAAAAMIDEMIGHVEKLGGLNG
jgi:hypothetical protein